MARFLISDFLVPRTLAFSATGPIQERLHFIVPTAPGTKYRYAAATVPTSFNIYNKHHAAFALGIFSGCIRTTTAPDTYCRTVIFIVAIKMWKKRRGGKIGTGTRARAFNRPATITGQNLALDIYHDVGIQAPIILTD